MDIYSLTDGKFVDSLSCIDNPFIRQLYSLAVTSAKNQKILGIIPNNFLSNKGDLAQNTLSGVGKSILNICNLTPLVDKDNCKSLVEDIAKYRWSKLDFDYDVLKDIKKETNKCLGPVNFLDPYPTDDKIEDPASD